MVKIFLFHRVSPDRDELWDPMDIKLFERCVKYITGHYDTVLLEDLLSGKKEYKADGKIMAAIVFDDGYKDNIEFAAPVLEHYGVKASFYVVTECIDERIPTWTYLLDYSFQFTSNDSINLQFDFLPEQLQIQNLKGKQSRIEYVRKLKPALKKVTHAQRQQVMNEIRNLYNDVQIPELMMNWDDLRKLDKAGHFIGSHTISHCMLGTMSNEIEIKQELVGSGKRIEDEIGYFPATISYPVGSFNETTKRLSREAGYKYGLAVKQNVYYPSKDDLFEIPRIELYNEPWPKTWLRIQNIIGRLNKIIGR